MPQISTQTITNEFAISTSYEKNDFCQNYGTDVETLSFNLSRITQTIGERLFLSDSQVQALMVGNLISRADSVLMEMSNFASNLITQDLDVINATLSAELLARNLARQLQIPRNQAVFELKKMSIKIRQSLYASEAKVAKLSNNLTGSKTDRTSQTDPFQRLSEYAFYDAFAIVRGPRRVEIIDFNKDIISVTTNLTTEITPGTFSVTLANPMEQYVDDYGIYAFYVGDTIRIFATNRIQKSNKDRYAHIFWGLIEQVQDDYSDGTARMTLAGQDITAWLQYTTVRTLPTVLGQPSPQIDVAEYGHKYANQSILSIIADVLFNDVKDFSSFEAYSLDNLNSASANAQLKQATVNATESIVNFWNQLFLNELTVRILGYTKQITIGNGNAQQFGKGSTVSAPVTDDTGQTEESVGLALDPATQCQSFKILEQYIPIRMFSGDQVVSFFQQEDTPKIEIIRKVIEGTMFEFFMDVDGAIVFKPPFYNEYPTNNDTQRYINLTISSGCTQGSSFQAVDNLAITEANDEYTIKDLDVVNFSIKEDSSGLVTRQEVLGEPRNFSGNVECFSGAYQNNDLVQRFGLRIGSQKKVRMINDAKDAITFAKGLMDYINLKFYSGSITIIGRPELHLGRTIYFEPRNVIFYIVGLSHNFTAGGTFTTTINVVAGRRMFIGLDGQPRVNVFDGEQFEQGGLSGVQAPLAYGVSSGGGPSGGTAVGTPGMTPQDAFNNIRNNGYYTPADLQALGGIIPRRISDSFGRRVYGTHPYGLQVNPPAQNPATNRFNQTQTPGATNANQGPTSGNTTQSNIQPSNRNAVGDPNIQTPTNASQLAQTLMGSIAGSQSATQPNASKATKPCTTGNQGAAFNPSSLVGRRVVNGGRL